jgi:hypothetical protein
MSHNLLAQSNKMHHSQSGVRGYLNVQATVNEMCNPVRCKHASSAEAASCLWPLCSGPLNNSKLQHCSSASKVAQQQR